MATGDRASAPLRAAATRMLGLDPEAPESARVAVLRRLRDADFLPDPATHTAVAARAGHKAGSALVRAAEEARLGAEVEAFASRFFDRPPEARRDRWVLVERACTGYGWLLDRLQDLAPGFDVDAEEFAPRSKTVAGLGADLLALFVLRPGPRAAESRRRAWSFRSDTGLTDADRRRAVQQLTRRHRDVAALDGGHLSRLVWPFVPVAPTPTRRRVKRFDYLAPTGAEVSPWKRTARVLITVGIVIRILGYLSRQQAPNPPRVPAASVSPLPPASPPPTEDAP